MNKFLLSLLLLIGTPALASPPPLTWGPDNKVLFFQGGVMWPQVATPAGSPSAGYVYVYPKVDNHLYMKTSAGVETQVDGGGGGGSGTVTTVSVATANGFAGTVANATSTPAITISTGVTGLLLGNGTAVSAATAGTDYSAGTSALGTGILKSTTGTGGLTIAIAGDFPTLNQNTTGTAAGLSATLGVGSGGTGIASITNHGFLIGSGTTTALRNLGAMPAGQVISGQGTTSDPAYTATPTLGTNAGGTKGQLLFQGGTSGTITVNPQAAAGTYNFNLPITAGSAGQWLTSQGGSTTAMTWTGGPLTSFIGTGSATAISGALTTVAWATSVQDTDSMQSAGTVTIPAGKGGTYHVDTNVQITGTIVLNSEIRCEVQVSGTAIKTLQAYAGGAETAQNCQISADLVLAAADTVRLQLLSGATTPVITNTAAKTFFNIRKVY